MSEGSDPIFARIAGRYDRINRILSLGQERKWRKRGIAMLEPGSVLDLGAGTGDTDFEGRRVVGLDPVIEMLTLSREDQRVVGVGEKLPFADESFDGVFSGYVFRNLTSIDNTLAEVRRVLRPGSAVVVVDLARPRSPLLARLHRLGTAIVLPLVGLFFAAAPAEYWYLHKTLDKLAAPEVIFEGHGLAVEEVWRMGLLGFVYGARLRKTDSGRRIADSGA